MIKICRRLDACLISNNKSCMEEEALKCGQFLDLEKKLRQFQFRAKSELEEKRHFSYSEPWYITFQEQLLRGISIKISKKEFMAIEDRIVEDYLKK